MKFKTIKPFVIELITFVFVISVIIIGLLVGDFIEISFHMHLITIIAIALIIIPLLSLFSRIVNLGVRALVDFVFQKTKEGVYEFLDEQPYEASVFTEKVGKNHERSFGMYYLIHLKKGNEVYTLISASYVDLIKGKTYIIKSGWSSNIFLNSVPIEE